MRIAKARDMLLRRVGHRGAFLLFLAFLDVVIGYALLTMPPAATAALDLYLPVAFWAAGWIVTAITCAAGAFASRDRYAFAAAAGMKAAWAAVSLRAWLWGHVPQGWIAVVIWAAFGVTVLLVSSWPEPLPPPRVPPPPRIPPAGEKP